MQDSNSDQVEPEQSTSTSSPAPDFSRPPVILAGATAPLRRTRPGDAFYRDAQVCPDGTCLLAAAEDRSLSLFDMPGSDISSWTPRWTWKPSDALLSYQWFPGATSLNVPYFAFAAAIKDHPIHLLDGTDRRVRASYPIIDHRERFIAPHSMAFSPDGTKLYCGFENAIEILDVSRPGAAGFRLHTSPTRSSRSGQKGIISTLAFTPDRSGLLAAGSFSGTVGLYDTTIGDHGKLVTLLKSSESGGITKVAFHPASHLLYCASRLSSTIEVWDMRNVSQMRGTIRREGRTNQRLGFDIDPTGTWLAAGDVNGNVEIFGAEFDEEHPEAVASFKASSGPVGSTSFTPDGKNLVTCSGARRFDLDLRLDSDEESSSDDEEQPVPDPVDSLQLWTLK